MGRFLLCFLFTCWAIGLILMQFVVDLRYLFRERRWPHVRASIVAGLMMWPAVFLGMFALGATLIVLMFAAGDQGGSGGVFAVLWAIGNVYIFATIAIFTTLAYRAGNRDEVPFGRFGTALAQRLIRKHGLDAPTASEAPSTT